MKFMDSLKMNTGLGRYKQDKLVESFQYSHSGGVTSRWRPYWWSTPDKINILYND